MQNIGAIGVYIYKNLIARSPRTQMILFLEACFTSRLRIVSAALYFINSKAHILLQIFEKETDQFLCPESVVAEAYLKGHF